MTASSEYNTGYQAAYGRLNGDRGDGWCAKEAGRNDDWLQVDLGKTIEVCAIATQGDRNGNEWVTAFKLSYSTDGNSWTPYRDANSAEVVSYVSVFANDKSHHEHSSVQILNMIYDIYFINSSLGLSKITRAFQRKRTS